MTSCPNQETYWSEHVGLAPTHEINIGFAWVKQVFCRGTGSTGRIRRYSKRVGFALESQGGHIGMRDGEAVFDVASTNSHGNGVATQGDLRSPCCVGFVSDKQVHPTITVAPSPTNAVAGGRRTSLR